MFGTAGLGMDSAISSNRKTTPKQKVDINPKKLKMGDGGKSKPKQIADVKALQQKLMDLKLLRTDTMVPTGYFGSLTQKALDAYNATGSVVTSKEKVDPKDKGKTTPNAGFIIVFAFPDYEPATDSSWFIDKVVAPITRTIYGTSGSDGKSGGGSSASGSGKGKQTKMGKMGHGGSIIIDANGNASLYEFGRYTSSDKGVVRSDNLGRIGKIQQGQLTNAKQVAEIAKRKTEGSGPRLAMDCVVLALPDPQKATSFAKVKQRDYALADPMRGGSMNCGTYSLEVAMEGGVQTSFNCFASPIGVVNHLKPGLDSFTV
jgi:hypothetical protein